MPCVNGKSILGGKQLEVQKLFPLHFSIIKLNPTTINRKWCYSGDNVEGDEMAPLGGHWHGGGGGGVTVVDKVALFVQHHLSAHE